MARYQETELNQKNFERIKNFVAYVTMGKVNIIIHIPYGDKEGMKEIIADLVENSE